MTTASARPTRHVPVDFVDRAMAVAASTIHRAADAWFGRRRTHRMLILEALAGIPSTVFAMQHHLRALRLLRDDAMVRRSVVQADHEHAHLLLFAALVSPTALEHVLLRAGQAIMLVTLGAVAVVSERAAQRLAGYFEEAAIESYDDYARAIERGDVQDALVPRWATRRWNLSDHARLRELVPVLREEEVSHRDEHHAAADALMLAARRSTRASPSHEKRTIA